MTPRETYLSLLRTVCPRQLIADYIEAKIGRPSIIKEIHSSTLDETEEALDWIVSVAVDKAVHNNRKHNREMSKTKRP